MIAVIFEFTPADGRKQDYFDLVAGLKPELEKAEGFLSIERFESITTPGKFVSLQFWRDEECIRKWRNLQQHREAQAKGRGGVFSGYRLRIDLENQTVIRPDGHAIRFDVEAFRKYCLLNGFDDIGLTLRQADKIRDFEARRRIEQPWLFA